MKRLIDWLRRKTPQQSIAGKEGQRTLGVRVNSERAEENDYIDETSFNWPATNRLEHSGSGNNILIQDQCDHEDTVPLITLTPGDDSLPVAEEDIGVDPYNTGRFGTASK